MSLFQPTVLKEYLKQQDDKIIEKAYRKYKAHFHNPDIQHNIRTSKEEQYQGEFLIDLFVKILGYVKSPTPNYNLITEFKNETGARKADGAILKDGKAIAVIELKGTKTKDLESIRKQAFDYKANQSDCIYIITSNFEKLRFYIHNAVDFEEFNLFTLNQEQFELLYLCLSAESINNNLPQTIKEKSVIAEEKITKTFYTDYSLFKRELFRDLVKQNMKNEVFRTELQKEDTERANKNIKRALFKTSQKLIDRFLFIFFAEDCGLLPANSTLQILEKWQADIDFGDEKPLYDIFKIYFNVLDTGRKGTTNRAEIFAYNGGLFKPDNVLSSLIIDDKLLHKHTSKLSAYDFSSQLDVNILGHIFENSLNEIESINAEIEGGEFDKQKSKRKKDGVFYTPKYITQYIVENTVGKLCLEKKQELGVIEEEYRRDQKGRQTATLKKLDQQLEDYRAWLLNIKICDPACGSGAFLNQALDFLIREHKNIDELSAALTGAAIVFPNIENSILENNIYGVDINEESVEIAKLSLWLRTAQPRRKLTSLNNNIKCGNSLIDDTKVAGDKAFSWESEFSEVFDNGGFDVVIGNPPYVRAELLGDSLEALKTTYKVFNPSADLFSYFYEKAFRILKKNIGIFGFISNTFDKTTAAVTLRTYLQENVVVDKYIDFTEVQIFEGATTYPVIITARNLPLDDESFTYIKIPKSSQSKSIHIDSHTTTQVEQSSLDSLSWSFKSKNAVNLISKLKKYDTVKEKYGKSYRGLLTGLNDAFIIPKTYPNGTNLKPIFEGKELEKWTAPEYQQQLILFPSKWTKQTYGKDISEENAIEKLKNDHSELINQILPFEDRAKKRYDKGEFYWELRNCAYYSLFESPKVVFPNLQNSNKFAFDKTGAYINAPAVILPTEDEFLTGILNSKLVWYFLTNICVVRSGGYIEVKPQYFEQIPIPEIAETQKDKLSLLTSKIIEHTKTTQILRSRFLKLIKSKFGLVKVSKKLSKWYDINFSDFQKELKKQKIKLSLNDEAEWLDFFEQQVKEHKDIVSQIRVAENEINQVVYELYALTEDEIKIVEE